MNYAGFSWKKSPKWDDLEKIWNHFYIAHLTLSQNDLFNELSVLKSYLNENWPDGIEIKIKYSRMYIQIFIRNTL